MSESFGLRQRLMPAIPAVVAALVTLYVTVAGRTNLPDPVASHFDLSGHVDDVTGRDLFFWCLSTIVVTAAGMAVGCAWVLRTRGARAMWLWGITYLAWLGTVVLVWTAVSQRGLTSAEQAPGPGWWGVLLLVVIPLAIASAVARFVGGIVPKVNHRDAARLGLGEGEVAVWVGRTMVRWPLLLGALGISFAVAMALMGQVWIAWVGLVLVVIALATYSLTVTVDARGLGLQWGLFGWPRQMIPIDRIVVASVEDIKPAQWGGWGYRGSLRLFGRAAAVLRAGEGLVCDLADGARFAVTVDDAATAAGLLNDLVARRAPANS